MSVSVAVQDVERNPLTITVRLTHSASGATRTFVATRPETVPYIHTGTRPVTDDELAQFQAASTRAQKRAAIRAIVEARLPDERPRLLAVVNAPVSAGTLSTDDLPPAFTTTDT